MLSHTPFSPNILALSHTFLLTCASAPSLSPYPSLATPLLPWIPLAHPRIHHPIKQYSLEMWCSIDFISQALKLQEDTSYIAIQRLFRAFFLFYVLFKSSSKYPFMAGSDQINVCESKVSTLLISSLSNYHSVCVHIFFSGLCCSDFSRFSSIYRSGFEISNFIDIYRE